MSISPGINTFTDDVRPLKIAVEGCGHGSLDTIYESVNQACATKGWLISDLDFLIICGDFQAVRNSLDLNCMSVPRIYRQLGDFHKYYSGASVAPVLTLVIGGNHEVSNYLFELYHGGWLAPNIYYLGAANVIRYGPYRIAGLSGIFKNSYYRKPHGERLPYSKDDIRSIYHVREFDVRKLLQIQTQVDIVLSHDWPTGVEMFGDYERLFARKPHFLESAKVDNLGSKPAAMLMNHLRPGYWFSGHMHIRFSADVEHAVTNTTTEFLALSKIGPDKQFLELKEIKLCSNTRPQEEPSYFQRGEDGKFFLQYDAEWLAITRAFADGLMIKDPSTLNIQQGKLEKACVASIPKHIKWVQEEIVKKDLLPVPKNFTIHAPVYNVEAEEGTTSHQQPVEYENSQTAQLYAILQIPNKFALSPETG
ncbi:lariat debranching enzyme, C-terminal domain-containing protein [Bisporella sp. PMI_857]|nr:lariat debranching enzyme, C-terminal domain-containing protein [Bisporella sp. PMI_857]